MKIDRGGREGTAEVEGEGRGQLRSRPGFAYSGKQLRSELKIYSYSCRFLVSEWTM